MSYACISLSYFILETEFCYIAGLDLDPQFSCLASPSTRIIDVHCDI